MSAAFRHNEQPRKTYTAGMSIEEAVKRSGLPEKDILKAASNENQLGVSDKAFAACTDILKNLNIYPSSDKSADLKKALCLAFSMEPGTVCLGNGSDEIIDLVYKTFLPRAGTAVFCVPTFSIYEICARIYGWKTVQLPLHRWAYDLSALEEEVNKGADLVFVCTPNNPTGAAVDTALLSRFIRRTAAKTRVCLDLAYSDFDTSQDYIPVFDCVREGLPVIILKTFSKLFGLAGLRLGMAFAPLPLIKDIESRAMPFNVNSAALAAGAAVLKDTSYIAEGVETAAAGRSELEDFFTEKNISFVPSQANFILFKGPAGIFEYLISKGIILRECTSFGLPGYLRLSIPDSKGINRFIQAFNEFSKQ